MTAHRLAELLGALSLATDGANGMPPETALRTAIVATAIGRASGLGGEALREVYLTALLRFLGCTAYAHETATRWGAGDDLAMMRAFMRADAASGIDVVRRAAQALGGEVAFGQRAAALARLSTDVRPADALALAHCGLATTLAARLGVGEGVVRALAEVFERYDGRGSPNRLAGEAISPTARLVVVAFRVVTYHALEGREAAVEAVRERRGTELDPQFAGAFLKAAGEVMDVIEGDARWEAFLEAEPRPLGWIQVDELPRIAEAFADYVDLKSPFTLGHSRGVAALAGQVGEEMGLDAQERAKLQVAALLHDLGRVAVPNGIWDKPGPLSAMERERADTHAWHTARILGRSPLFTAIAAVAAGGHERADGTGYPRAIPGSLLPVTTRILAACDVFHALGEDRPHRAAHGREAAVAVLLDEVRAGRLEARVVEAVLAVGGGRRGEGRAARGGPDELSAREVEVLCVLARGLSNKEIGARLGISAKTVQHHVAHIYEKTGVRTRAAAAIYAVDRGLLGP
ncbi:HD domain-containing phosphohydrolase [Chondromyces apiculatus]|nr:HD domain-containing phosphohydrolase [Chondromyces apiculatus]